MNHCRTKSIASWILQWIAAAILGQTLFFKFTGAEESRFIFMTLGAEPWGRVATGCAELLAVLLLLTPRTVTLGASLGSLLMLGAIGSHFAKLGIVVHNDGGLLFGLGVTVLSCCLTILILRRHQIPVLGAWLGPGPSAHPPINPCRH